MARKSAIGEVGDAFELFLDTITNTFGGVVFISLLVCVLLQIRGTPRKTDAEAETVRARAIETDLTAVRSEVARLEELDRRVRGQTASTSQETDRRLVAEYERLNTEKQSYETEIARLEAAEPLREQNVVDLQTQLANLQADQDRMHMQINDLEGKVKEAQNRSSHKIRLPRYHATIKQQIPLTIFNQRLCFPYEYDGRGNATKTNETDFTIKSGLAANSVLTPKPGHGTPVSSNDGFRVALMRQLAQFDKDKSYVHLAVWPDSYHECEIVRDILLDMGFGYGLLLLNSGGALIFSSTGQRGEL